MKYTLKDLISIDKFKSITEQFYNLTKVPFCLLDNNQNVIFTKGDPFFHNQRIQTPQEMHIPIIIENEHIASFVIGASMNKEVIADSHITHFKCIANLIEEMATQQLHLKKIHEKDSQMNAITNHEGDCLGSILQNMPIMINAIDEKGNIIMWNRECELVTGYNADEIINNPKVMKLLHPYRPNRNDFRDWEMDITCKNGEIKTIMWSNILHSIPTLGWNVGAIGIDITKRKRMEEKLKQTSNELELIFKAIPDLYFLSELDGTIKDCKVNSVSKFYVPIEEFIGKKFQEILPVPIIKQFEKAINQIKTSSAPVLIDYSLQLDDEIYYFEARLLPLFEDKIMIIVRDITERTITTELLKKSDTLNAVGQLAAGVAHKVRNPLTVIKGFMQLLQQEVGKDKECLSLILSEISSIEKVIQEFLSIAKPNAAVFEPKNLCTILDNVVDLISTQAIMKNIRITLNVDAENLLVECCEIQLKQVFYSILQNSIEAIQNGQEIIISVKKHNSTEIKISILDKGIGIPSERIKRLGEPFYSTKEKGTGVGLMMSYRIIESHGGKISIKSQVGKGTTVTLFFPIYNGDSVGDVSPNSM
ncbi:PAS domain-containing sensor histidine kinase [Bacillus cereus]|uniref:PAS domain-containing sensor histidine kinase n=1 Tax=Bacillus nitratireducens TaxID=2026193 RepID=UPI0002F05341|nr:PAS domain-containing sensor histidine kinase [Bacillus nitratireducens]PEW85769.1 PAS domain-containing sensor histidine kinase [Bacillus cereus]MED0992174.1 ATP-binding protein [Bacillus nitratireducens]OJD39460.1 PAS domain-containing sensor histidine kinase [Bacillus nitratireducens]PFJ74490.1 PAS domain-containing sensor histidine kinase [Bacillus cereus]PFN64417.1 PAS domain-containing sensor histidine kinase [Bacillus cereus]